MTGKNHTDELIVFFRSDQLGSGDKKLGQQLLSTFVDTLMQTQKRPDKLIFINQGVYLTCEGSTILEELQELEKSNTKIWSCGTCLNFYSLKDKLKVGIVSNMVDIVASLTNAALVIHP